MFEELHRKMNRFWNDDRTLEETDPEFVRMFSRFAYGEVVDEPAANDPRLDGPQRSIAVIAAIVGTQGIDAFETMLPVAYATGVGSVQLKEVIYQATTVIGFARALPFLTKLNAFLNARNVALPLEGQQAVADADMSARGRQIRSTVLGDDAYGAAGDAAAHVGRWIDEHCFGECYTRTGLDVAQRQMVTLCLLLGQGCSEARLVEQVRGNLNVGNDERYLVAVISQCLPYIGYPRALDALSCLREAAGTGTDRTDRGHGDADR